MGNEERQVHGALEEELEEIDRLERRHDRTSVAKSVISWVAIIALVFSGLAYAYGRRQPAVPYRGGGSQTYQSQGYKPSPTGYGVSAPATQRTPGVGPGQGAAGGCCGGGGGNTDGIQWQNQSQTGPSQGSAAVGTTASPVSSGR